MFRTRYHKAIFVKRYHIYIFCVIYDGLHKITPLPLNFRFFFFDFCSRFIVMLSLIWFLYAIRHIENVWLTHQNHFSTGHDITAHKCAFSLWPHFASNSYRQWCFNVHCIVCLVLIIFFVLLFNFSSFFLFKLLRWLVFYVTPSRCCLICREGWILPNTNSYNFRIHFRMIILYCDQRQQIIIGCV